MKLDLTMDEILEDLCYPGPAPGQWRSNSDQYARGTSEAYSGWRSMYPLTNGQNGRRRSRIARRVEPARDQHRAEPLTLEARVDLGMDERDQPRPAAILHEAGEFALDVDLVAMEVRLVDDHRGLTLLHRGDTFVFKDGEIAVQTVRYRLT